MILDHCYLGDLRDVLKPWPNGLFDAAVTDPPYHLTNKSGGPHGKGADTPYSRSGAGATSTGFMGKKWDGGNVAFDPATWVEVLRVLKPGAHLLAFGGSRTYHRLACAIEDAGFEIRDQIMWIYGSGFPKSKNLNGDWEGWGTALKPAHEPIVVARKPLVGTVAANVLAFGTGAINIDGCRVPHASAGDLEESLAKNPGRTDTVSSSVYGADRPQQSVNLNGRWPANVIHDGSDEVIALFPDSDGAGGSVPNVRITGYGDGIGTGKSEYFGGPRAPFESGSGSAARFFYCPKASRADRNQGLDGRDAPAVASGATMRDCENADWKARNDNHHPTVKPTDLIRYLLRLVTPTGGLSLDPFMGSGTTGVAAILEGFDFVGIETEREYFEIAQRRIAWAISRYRDDHRQGALELTERAQGYP